jgi:hypothetical protein
MDFCIHMFSCFRYLSSSCASMFCSLNIASSLRRSCTPCTSPYPFISSSLFLLLHPHPPRQLRVSASDFIPIGLGPPGPRTPDPDLPDYVRRTLLDLGPPLGSRSQAQRSRLHQTSSFRTSPASRPSDLGLGIGIASQSPLHLYLSLIQTSVHHTAANLAWNCRPGPEVLQLWIWC